MLDFLFYTIIIILVVLLLAPFVLASLGISILRHFSREMNDAKERKQRSKTGFKWGSAGKSGSSDKKATNGRQKVFADSEGTYVDFEEVKEGDA